MNLFAEISVNTALADPLWQQIGVQITAHLQTFALYIVHPLSHGAPTRSYEHEGWIFLKPGNLSQGARVLKPLDLPGRSITIGTLQSISKAVRNAIGDHPIIHVCTSRQPLRILFLD